MSTSNNSLIKVGNDWVEPSAIFIHTDVFTGFVPGSPPTPATVWKLVDEVWLNIDGTTWKKVYPKVLFPEIENQVEISSTTFFSTGIITLRGKNYHWTDFTSLQYNFEHSDDGGVTFPSIASGTPTNPSSGGSDSSSTYVLTNSNVTANTDNLYRFSVTASNSTYGTQTISTNSSITNITVNGARDISSLNPYATSTTEISMTWTAGAYSNSFLVEYKANSSGTWIPQGFINLTGSAGSSQGTTFSGLVSGTLYNFKVTPYTGLAGKGYFGNSATANAVTFTAPSNITNGTVLIGNTTSTTGTPTANITSISFVNSNFALVVCNTDNFVKSGSNIQITGATGNQTVVNGGSVAFKAPGLSSFYVYSPNGLFGSIGNQSYVSGCTVTYVDRVGYVAFLNWTPGANTDGYNITVQQWSSAGFYEVEYSSTLGAVSAYNFQTFSGITLTKNKKYKIILQPKNGSVTGNSYYFENIYVESGYAFNTISPENSSPADFIKISGYGTKTDPWEGDIYKLESGSWYVNGDGRYEVAVLLYDTPLITNDYLVATVFAGISASSRPDIPSDFGGYQIPNNSNLSQLYLTITAINQTILDVAFPGDEGLGTSSTAITGSVNNLAGPSNVTSLNSRGINSLQYYVFRQGSVQPNWYTSAFINNYAQVGGSGFSTYTGVESGVKSAAIDPFQYNLTGINSARWYDIYIYGYNNGVFSSDIKYFREYTNATAAPSVLTGLDFYIERVGNTVYWWKIADTYTNVHLLYLRLDRYVGGVYQTSYYSYYYPFSTTVTSNLSGYPNNPSTSLKYSYDISALPNGTYYPFMGSYNYNFGFSASDVATNYIGTTYPFIIGSGTTTTTPAPTTTTTTPAPTTTTTTPAPTTTTTTTTRDCGSCGCIVVSDSGTTYVYDCCANFCYEY
jgi:hypothetical protein